MAFMYQVSYAEVLADDPASARSQERFAFDHAIALLARAEAGQPGGREQEEALDFVNQLWGVLIKDLAHSNNDLPGELRARLMSIGLWVMGEAQRIQAGQTRGFRGIAEVCATIRDGLN